MERIEKVEFTNMCMIQDSDKVVVINRKANDWPGITFPGGHVENGESFTDAIIREIKEETNLNIYSPQLCGIKNWKENGIRYVVLLYKTNHFDGVLKSSDEGEVWWEEINNLSKLKLSLDMIDMIKVFNDNNLSEFFYYQNQDKWFYDLK